MQPADYQPRVNTWGTVWRVLLVLTISAAAWSDTVGWQWNHDRPWFLLDLALGAACFVLMFWRRQSPFTVALLTAVASVVSFSAGGPATLALVSLSTRRQWREIVPVAVISVAGALTLATLRPTADDPLILNGTIILTIIGVSVGWGLFIGSRRELLATLRERADRAEAEQYDRLEKARSAERTRIAREMHDVLAHRISTIAMHAGALSYRSDLSAEETRRSATVIQEASHEALTELREILGVLREDHGYGLGNGDEDESPEKPQPDARAITALVEQAHATGMNVTYACHVDVSTLGGSISRTLYRFVQEGLTNARKHAPFTLVQVTLDGRPGDYLACEVRNMLNIGDERLRAPESGLGLVGLAERAELAGGELSFEITESREFVLRTSIPWPA